MRNGQWDGEKQEHPLFLLTRKHIDRFSITAKLVGHCAQDGEVFRWHNCKLLRYLSIGEGTFIKLHKRKKKEKKKKNTQKY